MKISRLSEARKVILILAVICFGVSGCSTPAPQENTIKVLPVTGRGYTAVKDQIKLVSGIKPEMTDSDFWVKRLKDPDELIMTGDEIIAYNQKIVEDMPEVYDLNAYSSSLDKEELTGFINEYELPDSDMYGSDGRVLARDFFDQISANIDMAGIETSNPVLYGITVRKCNLRTFPTDAVVYNSAANRLDRFQETACNLGEPMLILHESKDKEWAFVQLYNYRGWLKREDIAVAADKKQLFDYTEAKDFVIAVDHCVIEDTDSKEEIKLFMGTKMQLLEEGKDYYKVAVPKRDGQGKLVLSDLYVARTEHLSKGYLDYTRSNIIRQAFKLQGTAYDWGGKADGYDCSSYIMSIYRTMGIRLARNAGQQSRTPGNETAFYGSDPMEQRLKKLEALQPGAVLYRPGHTMLYLGSFEGEQYIIHDFMGYSKDTGTGMQHVQVYAVAVSPISMIDDYGSPYLMKLTSALEFKPN
ncbi:MAG: SH3 domain-containing protein [Pseudomonadota bacterium]